MSALLEPLAPGLALVGFVWSLVRLFRLIRSAGEDPDAALIASLKPLPFDWNGDYTEYVCRTAHLWDERVRAPRPR